MARLSPSVLSKKRLRDDDHKDETTLDWIPATRGGSREVGLARRPNARSQDDGSDPREGYAQKLRITFLKQKMLSLTSFAIVSSILVKPDPGNGKGSGLTRGLIRIYI